MNTPLLTGPRGRGSWLQRVLFVVAAAGLLLVGFFFLTVALVVAAVLAVVGALVGWWFLRKLKRKIRATPGAVPLDGEYTVVERERVPTGVRSDR